VEKNFLKAILLSIFLIGCGENQSNKEIEKVIIEEDKEINVKIENEISIDNKIDQIEKIIIEEEDIIIENDSDLNNIEEVNKIIEEEKKSKENIKNEQLILTSDKEEITKEYEEYTTFIEEHIVIKDLENENINLLAYLESDKQEKYGIEIFIGLENNFKSQLKNYIEIEKGKISNQEYIGKEIIVKMIANNYYINLDFYDYSTNNLITRKKTYLKEKRKGLSFKKIVLSRTNI